MSEGYEVPLSYRGDRFYGVVKVGMLESDGKKAEMGGRISKEVWTQCPRPKGKVVLDPMRLFSRNVGERGEVVKHKRIFIA